MSYGPGVTPECNLVMVRLFFLYTYIYNMIPLPANYDVIILAAARYLITLIYEVKSFFRFSNDQLMIFFFILVFGNLQITHI